MEILSVERRANEYGAVLIISVERDGNTFNCWCGPDDLDRLIVRTTGFWRQKRLEITESQAAYLRDELSRGGFLNVKQ